MKRKSREKAKQEGAPKKQTAQDGALRKDGKDRDSSNESFEESGDNELYFRLLRKHSPLAIGIVQDGLFKFINQAFCNFCGYTDGEIKDWKPYEYSKVFHPDNRKFAMEQMEKKREGAPEEVGHYQFKGLTKSGEIKWLDLYSTAIMYGKKTADLVTILDISERKRMEEDLSAKEEFYRAVFENTGTATVVLEENAVISLANRRFEHLSGYSKQEVEGKMKWTEFVVEEDMKIMCLRHQRRRGHNKDVPNHYEFHFIDRDKNIHDIYLTAELIPGTKRSIASLLDITENKNAETALRTAQEQTSLIFNSSLDAIFFTAPDGSIYSANPSACRMFGRTEEEIRSLGRNGIIDVSDPRLASALEERSRTGIFRGELTGLRKDGSKFPIDISSVIFLDKEGRKRTSMIIRDITERKSAEEALRVNEELFSAVFNSSPIAIAIQRASDARLINVNEAWQKISGYTKQEALERRPNELDLLDDSVDLDNLIRLLEAQDSCQEMEIKLKKKSGDIAYMIMSVQKIIVAGEPCWLTMAIDITDRKHLEEAWKEEMLHRRILFEQSPDGILVIDPETTKFLEFNTAAHQQLGYTREEFANMCISDVEETESPEETKKKIGNVIREGRSDFETLQRTKQGEIRNVLVTAQKIDILGQSVYHCIWRDITESKQAEDALKEREEFLSSVIENIPDMIFVKDAEELRFVRLNRAGEDLLGHKRADLIGKNDYDLFPREQAEYFINKDKDVLSNGREIDIPEEPIDTKTEKRILHTKKIPICDKQGKPTYLLGISEDITERKRGEEQLNLSVRRLRESLRATIQAMAMTVEARDPYTAGHQRRVADLARAIAAELGLGHDLIEGVWMAGSIHDIGKISVPAEILSKPSKLSPLEYQLIKIHPQAGHEILKDINFPWPIARIILEHHERVNGSGYPNGLTGEKILLESRIVAVADTVEAMASHRPYRPSLGIDEALEEISRQSGILFDQEAAAACLKLFREKDYKLPD